LTKSADITRELLESIKLFSCGAAPTPTTLINELVNKFELTADFQEGYGMTEASPVTHLLPKKCSEKYGSCGGPLPGTLAASKDLNSDTFLGPNEEGEIVVKGPQVMVGYYKNPEATADTITPDGWLKTGDTGYYDNEGYFYIIDRVKELIKVKGLQV
jgi:long-subunit acyl-CoA synthetase (AMP-forming)